VQEFCNAGYGGDVWNEQPAGKDHPWRYMPFHAMTPHTSGVTIDAQVLQNASSSHYIMDY